MTRRFELDLLICLFKLLKTFMKTRLNLTLTECPLVVLFQVHINLHLSIKLRIYYNLYLIFMLGEITEGNSADIVS